MNAETSAPRVRLISGSAAQVEFELNLLLDDYAVTTWAFSVVGDQVVVTAILLAQSELRKMALANPGAIMGNSRGRS